MRSISTVSAPAAHAVVGTLCTVLGVTCRIVHLRSAGTVDVVALDGSGRSWRVSGLPVSTDEADDAEG